MHSKPRRRYAKGSAIGSNSIAHDARRGLRGRCERAATGGLTATEPSLIPPLGRPTDRGHLRILNGPSRRRRSDVSYQRLAKALPEHPVVVLLLFFVIYGLVSFLRD